MWQPSRRVVWLGHVFDLISNCLYITEERIDRLLRSIDLILEIIYRHEYSLLPVRKLASVVGQIISLYTVLGKRVRYKTRVIYLYSIKSELEFARDCLEKKALDKLRYWKSSVESLNGAGKPLHDLVLHDYLLFSYASSYGYGGYVMKNEIFEENTNSKYRFQEDITGDLAQLKRFPEVSTSFDEGRRGRVTGRVS